MRKFGKWLLVLGVLAASPAASSADGFLGTRLKPQLPFSGSEKARNDARANEVVAAMQSLGVTGSDIEVEVRDEVAVLYGRVEDASQKALAQRAASSISGIRSIENNIRVALPAGGIQQVSGNRLTEPVRSSVSQAAAFESAETSGRNIQRISGEEAAPAANNQAVAQQIADSLTQAGLVGYDIEIRFNNGVASLIGEVATVGQRQSATAAVSNIPGVKSVKNELRVSGPISQTAYNPGGAPIMAPPMMNPQMMPPHMMPPQGMNPQMMQAGYMQPGMPMDPSMPPSAMGYAPTSFNNPHLPSHAWPSYAQYPNSAAVSYPTQYSASAWPYIGPFYPYPQVPLGWREVSLEWDDGQWNLNFNKEKDKWYWVLHPKNW
jgi:osmotically-inducible protein OsmY